MGSIFKAEIGSATKIVGIHAPIHSYAAVRRIERAIEYYCPHRSLEC